jgi:hypothetical protein
MMGSGSLPSDEPPPDTLEQEPRHRDGQASRLSLGSFQRGFVRSEINPAMVLWCSETGHRKRKADNARFADGLLEDTR